MATSSFNPEQIAVRAKLGMMATDAPPGRVLTYLASPEKGTLPASCTLKVCDPNDLYGTLRFFSRILRDGAGGKAILNEMKNLDPISVDWRFFLSPLHPDYYRMSDTQRQHFSFLDGYEYDILIPVNDSMEECSDISYSIEESWRAFIEAAREGKRILVNLSGLRHAGRTNERGLRATGPLGLPGQENEGSFLAIYIFIARYLETGRIPEFIDLLGQLNQTIRRGGQFKDGIITSSMPSSHPCFLDYLKHPLRLIPGSHKKGVQFIEGDALPDEETLALIARKHNEESLFLEKLTKEDIKENYWWNVCVGIKLPDRGTCLIYRVNLAQCHTPEDIPMAFTSAVSKLLNLHLSWRAAVGASRSAHYAPLEQDRQIALDIMGLASALVHFGVTYKELAKALQAFLDNSPYDTESMAYKIVYNLAVGYRQSTIICDDTMEFYGLPKLRHIHCIEPQQKSAESYRDLKDYPCSRNIDPPFAVRQWRVSEASNPPRKLIQFNPAIEIANQLGAEFHLRFCELWQEFMSVCGRPHGISYDNWMYVTAADVKDFVTRSPLQTWYYNYARQIDQSYLDKGALPEIATDCSLDVGCPVCAE